MVVKEVFKHATLLRKKVLANWLNLEDAFVSVPYELIPYVLHTTTYLIKNYIQISISVFKSIGI